MTLFGEFRFGRDALPLADTLADRPDAAVELERVVVSERTLSPYVWADDADLAAFEATAESDPSVETLERMEAFDGEGLYRATWTEVGETIYAFVDPGVVVLEASGDATGWAVRLRFDTQEDIEAFQSFCEERDISFALGRLYHESQPMTAGQYGLTDKQREALVTAWEAGYFESPRAVTLEAVAETLDISHQSLSQRLRRAHHNLIANTLVVTPPADEEREGL